MAVRFRADVPPSSPTCSGCRRRRRAPRRKRPRKSTGWTLVAGVAQRIDDTAATLQQASSNRFATVWRCSTGSRDHRRFREPRASPAHGAQPRRPAAGPMPADDELFIG
jgi:hypothetical protein